ncbi:MAG: hypothetical protein ACE5QW_03805 [Thermoplasmata archaeon]
MTSEGSDIQEELPSGLAGEETSATEENKESRKIPLVLIVAGLIIIVGCHIGLSHLIVNKVDAEPLQWEIVIDFMAVGTLLVALGLAVGAFNPEIDNLVRLGMILGAAVMISLLVYQALVLFGTFQTLM